MSLVDLHRGRDHPGSHAAGWVVSALLHSALIVGALLFAQRIQLAPQSEPFRWNVALVSSDSPPVPSPAASSAGPSPALTPGKLATPSPVPLTKPTPPVPEPTQSDPIEHKVSAVTEVTSPTQLPQDNLEPVKPVPQTVTPTPSLTAKALESVQAAPSAPVAPPLPIEPIERMPVPVESVTPSSQTTDSEIAPAPPEKQPDSAMVATQTHSESSTPMSSVPSPSPEPAPSITSHMTTEPSDTVVPAPLSAPQVASLAPPVSGRPARADYGWLSEVILRRVEELKRYPAEARVDRTEGKVVVKAVINEDGSVDEVEVFQSSGSTTLDKAAVDLMRRAAPFSLPRVLGKPRVTIKIPMNYRLDR